MGIEKVQMGSRGLHQIPCARCRFVKFQGLGVRDIVVFGAMDNHDRCRDVGEFGAVGKMKFQEQPGR